ncbi:hypothetical protein [Streptomyces sp. CBMA29]|uniref:hypothetical protein n=1 Tax=Streptomyces sp. CBMA29 TaxID=1896314 RepID=UPI001661E48E|nr:hypothetical protein [Streptomyces sp. CBMA29]MBD0740665.1 hypothetical protein [Streptomyces sp. CBMA29]
MPRRTPLTALRDAVATGRDQYEVQLTSPGLRKLAAYAYVAEQFGYRYAGPAPGSRSMNQPLMTFRRSPELGELAARTAARYPDPAGGGPLPGMVEGRGLRPAKSAAGDVRLIHSRMVVDACLRYGRRVLKNILVLLVVIAVVLFFPGYTVRHVLVGAGVWLAFFAVYLIGLGIARLRLARHRNRLAASGVQWPPP